MEDSVLGEALMEVLHPVENVFGGICVERMRFMHAPMLLPHIFAELLERMPSYLPFTMYAVKIRQTSRTNG
eukprot:2192813-Amphidinium_carterae.2